MASRKSKKAPVTAAQLPPGTKIWGLASAIPTFLETTSETGGLLTTSLSKRLSRSAVRANSPAYTDSTRSSTTLPEDGSPPARSDFGSDCDKNGLLKTLLKANFTDMNGRMRMMDGVSFPQPPSTGGSKRLHDENEIEHAIKRQMGSSGGKIDKMNNVLDKMRAKPARKPAAPRPPREIAPLKYTKYQRKADVATAWGILGKHFSTLPITKTKRRGTDKVSLEYFSLLRNRDFFDILQKTNDIGKKKMIEMAVSMLVNKLADTEAREKRLFDYRTFEVQYQEALEGLSTGAFSVPYIKRNVKNAAKILENTSAENKAGPNVKPKNFPAKADYRLVWPALVFQLAWTHKDYKQNNGVNCFKAAGFMLEAILNNAVRKRALPCSGHQEWYCRACPGSL